MKIHLPHKIPSIVGILLIGVLVYMVSLGSNQFFNTKSNASPTITPKSVTITNITDSSFTVTWLTDSPATGAVILTGGGLKMQSYFDERDKQNGLKSYTAHSVTIHELPSNTEYTFIILSNNIKYDSKTNDYKALTASVITAQSGNIGPAYGTVRTTDDKPATDTLVYLSFDGSQTFSTLVTDSGSWLIPIHLIRTKDLTNYINFNTTTPMQIRFIQANGEATVLTNTLTSAPVPEVTIGKSYDFRLQSKTKGAVAGAQTTSQNTTKHVSMGELTVKTTLANATVSFIQPADESSISINPPLFSGTGIPGKQLELLLTGITPKSFILTVADDGIWRFTPPGLIGIGKQSATIKTTDAAGKNISFVHAFEIMKSGTRVLGVATPSATLVPTRTPSIFPSPTLALAAVTPTLVPSPTEVATQSINLHPGNESATLLLIILGSLLVCGGVILAKQT